MSHDYKLPALFIATAQHIREMELKDFKNLLAKDTSETTAGC